MSTVEIEELDKQINQVFRQSHHGSFDQIIIPEDLTYHSVLANKMLIIWLIQTGVPYSLFDLIRHYTPFNETDWAGFLDISTKSMQRYKSEDRHFKPMQSEKIIELAEVTNLGIEVFGDVERFRLWLETPNYALGNLKPKDLLKDSYGKEMVITELTHINHGILS
jgi:putative toxin-antitoxin system antitoxin component (TIGR02293 family)